MSEFRFACPHCSQRILCDSTYRGSEITCPNCQQKLTVPAIRAVAPVATATERAALSGPPIPAAAAQTEKSPMLAIASFVCSLVLGVGCIPGIICGHLAYSRARRNPTLPGRRLALGGLIIGYVCLLASFGVLAMGFLVLEPKHGHQLSAKESASNTHEALAPRRVDEVVPGDLDSESAHALRAEISYNGKFNQKSFRHAVAGGSFSYVMKVDPAKPMSLYCTYWGSDNGPPTRWFDIVVENETIATQRLDYNAPGDFFDVEYRIPSRLTSGKHQVAVRFQAAPGDTAGGLFGCQMLRR